MDTPSSGRVADRVAPRFTSNPTRTWIVLSYALAVMIVVSVSAGAQDDLQPESAVMAPLAAKTLALDVAAVDDALVVVGERGHILISTDGGTTWVQQEVPTRAVLTGVYFHDRMLGWVVGHDAVILRTTDGGVSWELVNWAPEEEAPLFDVWFSDASNGIAIGAYGTFYRTADGGVSWEPESLGDADWHLHQIARAPNGRLYMSAEAGFVYRSDDEGETWEELPSPYEGSFFGSLPLDNDEVLLFGLRGHMFRSEDAGESWTPIETGTVAMLTGGLKLPDGKIIITGLAGTMLISDDGGKTFVESEQAGRRGIQAAEMASDDSLVLVGEFGVKILPISELASGKDR